MFEQKDNLEVNSLLVNDFVLLSLACDYSSILEIAIMRIPAFIVLLKMYKAQNLVNLSYKTSITLL